jgi:hypothetical protein
MVPLQEVEYPEETDVEAIIVVVPLLFPCVDANAILEIFEFVPEVGFTDEPSQT